ncbi:hypothetical protein DL93DRAFT_2071750 [Clavulina sp. PMI_390]|nr:hypothetical protein DL93DRAFT_2071750 [Clavulina sp. PMI_390]
MSCALPFVSALLFAVTIAVVLASPTFRLSATRTPVSGHPVRHDSEWTPGGSPSLTSPLSPVAHPRSPSGPSPPS